MRSSHLMSLVDDDGVIGQRFHDVKVFDSSWRQRQKQELIKLKSSEG